MKQTWTLRIYRLDRRLTRGQGRNRPGLRCVGSYEFQNRDEAAMQRERRELEYLYPRDKFTIEFFPAYKTVKNLMTGAAVEIPTDTPRCCDPSSETYWSM